MGGKWGESASQQPDEWVRREIAAIQANQRKTNELLKEILDCRANAGPGGLMAGAVWDGAFTGSRPIAVIAPVGDRDHPEHIHPAHPGARRARAPARYHAHSTPRCRKSSRRRS